MNIGEAVVAMKDGELVRRSGWNAQNMHIYLDHWTFAIGEGVFKGKHREWAPVVVLFNARGIHQPGWVCSQEDLLADDWEVVE